MKSSEGIGRAGEFLVASILEARGIRASHVAIHGTDLWVETPSGRMLRVQVKTSSKPAKEQRGNSRAYRFLNPSRPRSGVPEPHIYCLVALDLGLMVVVSRMAKGGSRVAVSRFTEAEQEAGIAEYLY
jgi:hypothetical protein